MADARALLISHHGFRVHFERRENGMLAGDFFPDREEPAIPTEDEAWKLAEQWAAIDRKTFVNVYVIQAFDFVPVENYRLRRLNTYPTVAEDRSTSDAVGLSRG